MKKLRTVTGAALVLAALSTGASAWASTPPGAIARAAPAGINPSTPRANWNPCDSYASLQGISYGAPVGDAAQQWRDARAFQWIQPQTNPGAPGYEPFPARVPQPAYVACTLDGPFSGASWSQRLTYTTTVTDVAGQAVFVALPTGGRWHTYGQIWAHMAWQELAPGQSISFTQRRSLRNLGFLLAVRPRVAPSIIGSWGRSNWLGYTEWVAESPNPFITPPPRAPTGVCSGRTPGMATSVASAPGGGYWVSSVTGEVAACGARQLGSYGDALYGNPVFNNLDNEDGPYIVSDPAGDGYWAVSSYGKVNAYGAAHWYGQYNRNTLVTGAVSTVSGKGYWLVSADGAVYHYGDAPYFGSAHVVRGIAGSITVTPIGIVGIAPTEGDHGYVLVARDGAVYGFGSHRGEACGPVALPRGVYVSGVAPDYRTGGYWVAETDGHVVSCHAPSFPYKAVQGTIMGIGALGNGLGYRLVNNNGDVYDYGAATFRGNA